MIDVVLMASGRISHRYRSQLTSSSSFVLIACPVHVAGPGSVLHAHASACPTGSSPTVHLVFHMRFCRAQMSHGVLSEIVQQHIE